MGGDLGGLGDAPPKFEVGTVHASAPNILRSSVIGSVGKYEQTKKGVKVPQGGHFSEIEVFSVKNRVTYIRFQTAQIGKKGHCKIWSAKFFSLSPKLDVKSSPMTTLCVNSFV